MGILDDAGSPVWSGHNLCGSVHVHKDHQLGGVQVSAGSEPRGAVSACECDVH